MHWIHYHILFVLSLHPFLTMNRYYTPVEVYFYTLADGNAEYFSDMQMAYFRIRSFVEMNPSEWRQPIPTFENFADSMDREVQENGP